MWVRSSRLFLMMLLWGSWIGLWSTRWGWGVVRLRGCLLSGVLWMVFCQGSIRSWLVVGEGVGVVRGVPTRPLILIGSW